MAQWYYDPDSKGFYNSEVHKTIPPNAVEITPERRRELLDGQKQGKEIYPTDTGQPALRERSVDAETLSNIELAKLRKEALDHYIQNTPSLKARRNTILGVPE